MPGNQEPHRGGQRFPHGPTMRGRKDVSRDALVEQIQETLVEREQVLLNLQRGEQPPFEFEQAIWKPPRDLLDCGE